MPGRIRWGRRSVAALTRAELLGWNSARGFLSLALLRLVEGSGCAPCGGAAFAIAPPTVITELARRLLHGAPSRLSWSSDGAALYVQSRDGVGDAARVRHFQIRLGSG